MLPVQVILLEDDNLLCVPTTPRPAPHRKSTDQDISDIRYRTMLLTSIASLLGLPQVTIPIPSYNNCPIGISFISTRFRDMELLKFINQIEL